MKQTKDMCEHTIENYFYLSKHKKLIVYLLQFLLPSICCNPKNLLKCAIEALM